MIVWRESFDDIPREGAVVLCCGFDASRRLAVQAPPWTASLRLALAPTERDLAEAPGREPVRENFLARRAMTRRLVAARVNIDAHDVVIGHAASGEPMVVAPVCGLHISVSGRENVCAISIAEAAIGVDIEPLGAPLEPAWNILHNDERGVLLALEESARREMFLRFWTAKEAYLKALGVGLSREPSQIAIANGDEYSFVIQDAAPSLRAEGEAIQASPHGSGSLRSARDGAERSPTKPVIGAWRSLVLNRRDFIVACVVGA